MRRRLLAALGDDELAAGREPQGAGELAHVGGLREGVGEQLVDVGLAVAVRVAQTPDAVAVEDVDLLVANRERQRLVQAGGEAPPADRPGRFVQAADEPDVAVERHAHAGAVREELDVAEAHVAAPRIVERQRDVVHDVGVLRRRARDPAGRPPAASDARGSVGRNRARRDGRRRRRPREQRRRTRPARRAAARARPTPWLAVSSRGSLRRRPCESADRAWSPGRRASDGSVA